MLIPRSFSGVTTGRRRRCGWLDLVIVQYSTTVNSYTAINLTKLDILDTFTEVKVAVAYRDPVTKEKIEPFPTDLDLLEKVEVEYITLKGWNESISACREYSQLPLSCREYCECIERFVGVKIKHIGVGKSTSTTSPNCRRALLTSNIGPNREDMIIR